MCLAIDQKALSDVFHGQAVLVRDVKLVEALRDYLVQVSIEELRHTLDSCLKLERLCLVIEEEGTDPHRLILAKLRSNCVLEVLQVNYWCLVCHTSWVGSKFLCVDHVFPHAIYCSPLVLIEAETVHNLTQAVRHVELIHVAAMLSEVCVAHWALVKLTSLGHRDEFCLEQRIDRGTLLGVDC